MAAFRNKRIWIDLDNSPHVPFFKPLIEKLEAHGYKMMLTARDCFQVRELADFHGLRCRLIGRHYGRNKLLKVIGLFVRALQLAPIVWRQRPDLALSHGSRAQMLVASIVGIPSALILDYEHVAMLPFIRPTWVIAPELISDKLLKNYATIIMKYPGIKEDVYVSSFKPDTRFLANLGINGEDLVVTIRPPATEAHYHDAKSEELFEASIDFLGQNQNMRMVLLSRNEKQAVLVRKRWPQWCMSGKIIMPDHVVNGLNLIWHSDLVISGGGTINREAAALGVPAYSIFSGKIGAVDQYLVRTGRLILLKNVADIRTKIILRPWQRPATLDHSHRVALDHIVDRVVAILGYGTQMAGELKEFSLAKHDYSAAMPN